LSLRKPGQKNTNALRYKDEVVVAVAVLVAVEVMVVEAVAVFEAEPVTMFDVEVLALTVVKVVPVTVKDHDVVVEVAMFGIMGVVSMVMTVE
jgi:hypothetical protein